MSLTAPVSEVTYPSKPESDDVISIKTHVSIKESCYLSREDADKGAPAMVEEEVDEEGEESVVFSL